MQQGGLSLPSHDTLTVRAMQSPLHERSLVQSAKRCCLQERLNNSVFCSRMFLLCTPLKYDHIPYLILLLIYGTPFPSQNKPEIWLQILKWTKHQLSLYHNLPMLYRFFHACLTFSLDYPSYSRKTINRMHTIINIGNYWLHCDVMLFMLKFKCLVAQLHLGL